MDHQKFLTIIQNNLDCEKSSFLYSLHEVGEIDDEQYYSLMGCLYYFKYGLELDHLKDRFKDEECKILLKINKICSMILRKVMYRFGGVDPEPFKLGKITRRKFIDEYIDPLIMLSEELTKAILEKLHKENKI